MAKFKRSNDIKLETLAKAKECLNEIDFTEQATYIVEVSQEREAHNKIKKIIPSIYIMGFIDATNMLNGGGFNGSSKK